MKFEGLTQKPVGEVFQTRAGSWMKVLAYIGRTERGTFEHEVEYADPPFVPGWGLKLRVGERVGFTDLPGFEANPTPHGVVEEVKPHGVHVRLQGRQTGHTGLFLGSVWVGDQTPGLKVWRYRAETELLLQIGLDALWTKLVNEGGFGLFVRDVGRVLHSETDESLRHGRDFMSGAVDSVSDPYTRGLVAALIEVIDGQRAARVR